MRQAAICLVPEFSEDRIEFRREWNQVCLVALTEGIPSGCVDVEDVWCNIMGISEEALPCTRCEHKKDMMANPDSAFIGFKYPE